MKKLPFNLKPTDIDFVMRSFVYALVILAILNAFQPYIDDSRADPSREVVEDLARQSRMVASSEVVNFLENSTRPTMLLVYASWCGYCKKVLPSIYELWSDGRVSGEQMILVSMDSRPTALAQYMLENGYQGMLGVPMVLQKDKTAPLSAALRTLGANYGGGIPYIGFYAPGGKMLHEIQGYVEKEEIERALVHLK